MFLYGTFLSRPKYCFGALVDLLLLFPILSYLEQHFATCTDLGGGSGDLQGTVSLQVIMGNRIAAHQLIR